MRRSFAKDDVNFQESEWFLAQLTEKGTTPTGECTNTPYAWEMLDYCANGQATQIIGSPDNFGTTTLRPAYPIDTTTEPTVPSTVLMRLRGTFNGLTVYEFVNGGGTTPPTPAGDTVCFGVKSVSCSGGTLMVTLADSGGCLNCTSGVAFYSLSTASTIAPNTQTPIPMNWNIIFGDLADVGMEVDGATFKNNFGSEIKIKVTIQYYWSTSDTVTTVNNRSAYIVKNGDTNVIPVASFMAQAYGTTAQVATNVFTLADGDYFQPYAYQNSAISINLGGSQPVPTTLLIERLCG